MPDRNELFALFDVLSPEEQSELQAVLKKNPELADQFADWQAVRLSVRKQLEDAVPSREDLVHYALAEGEGHAGSGALSAERASELARALQDHPGLRDVVGDIQSAAKEWDELWSTPTPKRADRAPRRRSALSRRLRPSLITAMALAVAFFVFQSLTTLTIEAPSGQFTSVELEDGSTVRLIGDSRMVYSRPVRWVRPGRKVRLEGQAFFRVSPHAEPFLVETHNARAEALGTHFSVRTEAQFTEVILTQGRVTLTPKRRKKVSVMLDPGQVSRVVSSRDAPTPPAVVQDLTESLQWTGLFVFIDAPLSDAVAFLSQHFETPIELDPAIRDEELVATFDPAVMDLDTMLTSIATAMGAQVQQPAPGVFRISKPPISI